MMKLIGILSFLLLLLVGCGQAATPAPTDVPGGASDIQVAVVTNDFAVGRPRLPFILYSGPQRVADVQRVTLTALDLSQETPVPRWTGEATSYSDYAVPYWVAYPELVLADEMVEWGFSSEPWTYVLDGEGEVVARFGGPVSPGELIAALEPLLP